MKRLSAAAIVTLALALSACGKKDAATPEATTAANSMAGDPQSVAPAALTPAQTFANTAAASDAFEIQASQLAEQKAQSAKVKRFAAQMIKAHTDSTAKLKTAAAGATPAITPDAQLSPAQQQTLGDLQSKSGAGFDTAYAKAQVDAHQATLDALKAYSGSGEVPSLKSFATGLVPTVTAHLNMAKGL